MIHTVKIHCDVVHPASGEVLAEAGETLGDKDPKLVRAFNVVLEYPDFYTYQLEDDMTHIRRVSLIEGCPTDEEIQLAQDTADQEEEDYVPLVEFVRGWKEGRGYGDFPKEGL